MTLASLYRSWRVLACLAALHTPSDAESMVAGEIGTIEHVDSAGLIHFIPWGKSAAEMASLAVGSTPAVVIDGVQRAAKDLKPGMWMKIDEFGSGVSHTLIRAGEFLSADGGRVIIFKGLPGEFLQRDVKDWYTNEAGGVKFKVQLMRGSGGQTTTGANLRPASYREPAEGFVFYLPANLKGAVVNVHGAKPGVTTPDAEGKIVINKETVTESYWSHPKNPVKPELGATSGLTELTIRKLPAPTL